MTEMYSAAPISPGRGRPVCRPGVELYAGCKTMHRPPNLSFRGGRQPDVGIRSLFPGSTSHMRGCGMPRRCAPRNDRNVQHRMDFNGQGPTCVSARRPSLRGHLPQKGRLCAASLFSFSYSLSQIENPSTLNESGKIPVLRRERCKTGKSCYNVYRSSNSSKIRGESP